MPPSFQKVRALRPASHIRVIAPASPFPAEDFARGVARLEERYQVSYSPSIRAREGFLAGDDARRLAELRTALQDPDVDAIVAARGGYGVTRLLPYLSIDDIREARKLLVGFSDLSALHASFQRAGLRSLHGSMVAGLGRASETELARWIAAVEGEPPAPFEGLETIAGGVAEGPLVGGNLAVLCALIGTPHAPPLDGAVLLLEDVGERPYRIDRMLTTLRQAGWLHRVAAIALGEFTACEAGPDGREITDVLHERLGDLGIPVVGGLPSGHGDENVELPLGAPARVSAGHLSFLEGCVF